MADIRMVVGLGNPGKEYADTRHNAGFWVVDSICRKLDVKVSKKKKFAAVFGECEFEDKIKLILLKPWQFMNCSGQVVATAVGFYKLPVENLLVVTDDMALEPGRIRIRAKGSSGGHKGLQDIIEKLGTDSFGRLRVGIGQCEQEDAVDFVLDEPDLEEQSLLESAVVKAREAVLCWVKYGIDKAMNEFNSNDIVNN